MKRKEEIEMNDDVIGDYISGKLSDEEKVAVDKRIKTDDDFAMEVKFYKKLKVAFIQREYDEMLKHVPAAYRERRRKNLRIVTYTVSAAAVIVVIAMMTIFNEPDEMEQQQNSITGTDFIKRFFEAPQHLLNQTMMGVDEEKPGESAVELYKQGNYVDAAREFDKLLLHDPEESIMFYAGACYMATAEIDKALPLFQELKNRDAFYKNTLNWYTALIYLEKGQNEKALPFLEELSAKENEFSEKVETVLGEIGGSDKG
ncbi:MAG: hypothetical protein K9H64_23635 [Bacteroidales bacterium]|nr:hypothetical protein [Bacteroidales bacterium]MCF8459033.1 hypothetical protein [Bacteroidales bacterium]